ncbi:MAG: RnfABCDGE type electron transport complex subunit B [Betaproteobacteria bacterium]|nr:RnfABCDGE type electron transport complex subunit B [Betaproteobacteria bacterium]
MTGAAVDRIRRIDALLPQTQCRQCGYPGCRPYAEALAADRADINQCPPGGDEIARELAALLGVAFKSVDARFGITKPPAVAVIDEALCIGCTLCIQACPVDAIVGAAQFMHTVIAHDCTGCELCLPPCPVDCIRMVATGAQPARDERRFAAGRARRRFELHVARLDRERQAKRDTNRGVKHPTVQRAIERAKLRLAQRKQSGKLSGKP